MKHALVDAVVHGRKNDRLRRWDCAGLQKTISRVFGGIWRSSSPTRVESFVRSTLETPHLPAQTGLASLICIDAYQFLSF